MKTELLNNVTRTFSRVGLRIQKHSPEILVVAGVGGMIISAVMACKASRELDEVFEEHDKRVEPIKEALACQEELPDEVTEKECKKALTVAYAHTGLELAKLYGPAAVVGGLSIAGIFAGNHILRGRLTATAAAYAIVDKGFKEYRGRVVERFGEELDKELRYNIKTEEVEEIEVDEKTGKEKVVKKTVQVAQPTLSDYVKFFDEQCPGWKKNAEFNLLFLKQQQEYANEKFKAQGHLFLNEAFDLVGLPRTVIGNIVGWIYDPSRTDIDNYVDFGIYEMTNKDFVNGRERVAILNFNVDGPILDLI